MKHRALSLFGISAFILLGSMWFMPTAYGASNIVLGNQWAWNDVIGWIDMRYEGNLNVTVSDTELGGYASSSVGYIAFNCSTSLGNSCAAGNWKVLNDGEGNLSGWAWSDAIGWVSFSNITSGGSIPYAVSIDLATGDFSGWAWNDIIGWVSFNSTTGGGSTSYKVETTWSSEGSEGGDDWLISSTLDTCPSDIDCGVALNTITWQGSSLFGSRVKFQIATDCLSGTLPDCGEWNFLGPTGANSFYIPVSWNVPIKIHQLNHLNKRYFRYKIFLEASGGATPVVEDVIINWSP